MDARESYCGVVWVGLGMRVGWIGLILNGRCQVSCGGLPAPGCNWAFKQLSPPATWSKSSPFCMCSYRTPLIKSHYVRRCSCPPLCDLINGSFDVEFQIGRLTPLGGLSLLRFPPSAVFECRFVRILKESSGKFKRHCLGRRLFLDSYPSRIFFFHTMLNLKFQNNLSAFYYFLSVEAWFK